MTTIEERAKEYAAKCHGCQNTEWGFIAGAQSEHELLTRWRDVKKELPEDGVEVLVKCVSGSCVVDFYAAELGCFFGEHATYMQVIGWRPIEE